MQKSLLLIGSAAFLLAACANTTTTKFYRDPSGALVIESPKNIHAEGVDIQSPNGTHLKIASWDSHIDPASTAAQGTREANDVSSTATLVGNAVATALKGQAIAQ